jgi:uncharacterized protein (TIGR00299 family) protein
MGILLLDAFGGLAGDMLLGGLLDLGASADLLRLHLSSIGLPRFELVVEPATRRHLGCTRVRWEVEDETDHRHLPDILAMITGSSLPVRARAMAEEAFGRLAEAEARVHRIDVDAVHFHEVGAADAILDICGVCLALTELEVDEILCTPLPGGQGEIRCDHGTMPALAPATAELLKGFPVLAGAGDGEQVTPTGAALLATWGRPLPRGTAVTLGAAGYGAGTRESSVLRLAHAELAEARGQDTVAVLETHLDDRTGEELAYLLERLLEAGALDAAYAPLVMKKGRPGVALTCMARPEERDQVREVLLRESGTLGVRERLVERTVLPREVREVETRFGPLAVKVSGDRAEPEYEPCARAAREHGIPLREVYEEVRRAFRDS